MREQRPVGGVDRRQPRVHRQPLLVSVGEPEARVEWLAAGGG